LREATPREGDSASPQVFRGHTAVVWTVAISPDGANIVSGSHDGTLRVWDAETGRERARFTGHAGRIYCAAILPEGKRVLSGSSSVSSGQPDAGAWQVSLWDLQSGKELRRLEGPADSINSIAVSRSGEWALLGGYSGKVTLWDVENWRALKVLQATPRLWSVALSPDEGRAVTASGRYLSPAGEDMQGALQVWNLATGNEQVHLAGHEQGIWQAVFSSRGDQIASTGGDYAIRLWDAETGALIHAQMTSDVTTGVAYSADGRRLLTGNYGTGPTVALWNLADHRQVASFSGHVSGVQSVAISPDGRWAVSGSHDGTVRRWDLPR
jgi:WD40 repeat protein